MLKIRKITNAKSLVTSHNAAILETYAKSLFPLY